MKSLGEFDRNLLELNQIILVTDPPVKIFGLFFGAKCLTQVRYYRRSLPRRRRPPPAVPRIPRLGEATKLSVEASWSLWEPFKKCPLIGLPKSWNVSGFFRFIAVSERNSWIRGLLRMVFGPSLARSGKTTTFMGETWKPREGLYIFAIPEPRLQRPDSPRQFRIRSYKIVQIGA